MENVFHEHKRCDLIKVTRLLPCVVLHMDSHFQFRVSTRSHTSLSWTRQFSHSHACFSSTRTPLPHNHHFKPQLFPQQHNPTSFQYTAKTAQTKHWNHLSSRLRTASFFSSSEQKRDSDPYIDHKSQE